MGHNSRRNSNRSNIKFPKNFSEALRLQVGSTDLMVRNLPRVEKINIPTGKGLLRDQRYGSTQEEQLSMLAPSDASKPEKMVYGWLVRNGIPFGYQVAVLGGRLPGGAVIDFVISIGLKLTALRVMGYWHTQGNQPFADSMQKEALEEDGYIVVDVWEEQLSTVEETHWTMVSILYSNIHRAGGVVSGEGGVTNNCPYCNYSDCVRCDNIEGY